MNKIRQVSLHAVIWISVLLFFLFFGSEDAFPAYSQFVVVVYFGIVNIAVFYANYLFLLPGLLSKKSYWSFVAGMIAVLILSALLKYAIARLYSDFIPLVNAGTNQAISFSDYFSGALLISIFFTFLGSAARFSVDWFVNDKLRQKLENEKLQAELAFLRSQINPHFLFNSLNNIYSLAYQKSDEAPKAILKLSDMMRYMLNESNEGRVSLCKEIAYLKNYIELQKLRFKDQAFIQLDIRGEENCKQAIVPLILITFVENAFKHGNPSDALHPIRISFQVEDGRLDFAISNRKGVHNRDICKGIGLANARRRLELLYPGRYDLKINDSEEGYNCELSLVL